MLPEPELMLVVRYLMEGGEIKEIPFGVSGTSWNFGKTARQSGSWGAFRRYGGLHIEAAALPYIAAGQLTAAQARVGLVWALLRRTGPLTVKEMAAALRLSRRVTRATVLVLTELGAVQAAHTRLNGRAPRKLAAVDVRPPHWTDYLPAEKQAA